MNVAMNNIVKNVARNIARKSGEPLSCEFTIFLKNYLATATSTICRPERTPFVVFHETSIVQIPLVISKDSYKILC